MSCVVRAAGDTRERILKEAALLFTRRGFHGTSTRDIAAAVGIRQQSLFHHFEHKQAILADLLDHDLDPTISRLRRLRKRDVSPAAQLYAHLVLDVEAILASPFDSRGIYNDDVLGEPGFEVQHKKRSRLHALITQLVADGVRAGDFVELDPVFVQQAVTALTLETMWARGAEPGRVPSGRPDEIADFVLRAIIADGRQVVAVRSEAAPLVEAERRRRQDATSASAS